MLHDILQSLSKNSEAYKNYEYLIEEQSTKFFGRIWKRCESIKELHRALVDRREIRRVTVRVYDVNGNEKLLPKPLSLDEMVDNKLFWTMDLLRRKPVMCRWNGKGEQKLLVWKGFCFKTSGDVREWLSFFENCLRFSPLENKKIYWYDLEGNDED